MTFQMQASVPSWWLRYYLSTIHGYGKDCFCSGFEDLKIGLRQHRLEEDGTMRSDPFHLMDQEQ